MLVSQVHMECVGESRSVLSTLDKLKRVELKMELLTRDLEQMPRKKVDSRVRTLIENGVKLKHRSLFAREPPP